jgi:hypothetical protein
MYEVFVESVCRWSHTQFHHGSVRRESHDQEITKVPLAGELRKFPVLTNYTFMIRLFDRKSHTLPLGLDLNI